MALSVLPVYRTYDPLSAGEFITRFQQTTPAIMAKGVEDTAFYRYGRLLALNDVGGDPGRFGFGVDDFHARNAERATRHPEALLTTMTHDTKRSTDTRARIAALTELPDEWAAGVRRWIELSERHCTTIDGRVAPDLQERYFILQTLVGVWPIEPERLDGYLEKALREAKRNTNWIEQDEDYEQAVKRFARALMSDERFAAEFGPFVAEVARRGARSTLSQLTLRLTAPGVPDTYQGDELEFRALVDPDNRGPVDWELRRERLDYLLGGGRPGDDLGDRKLWVTARLLGLRARRAQAFATGGYEPLASGRRRLRVPARRRDPDRRRAARAPTRPTSRASAGCRVGAGAKSSPAKSAPSTVARRCRTSSAPTWGWPSTSDSEAARAGKRRRPCRR